MKVGVPERDLKAMWISMYSMSSGGKLPANGMIGDEVGSLVLSENEINLILDEFSSGNGRPINRKESEYYENSVRLVITSDHELLFISDGCGLVEIEKDIRIDLPDFLVEATGNQRTDRFQNRSRMLLKSRG